MNSAKSQHSIKTYNVDDLFHIHFKLGTQMKKQYGFPYFTAIKLLMIRKNFLVCLFVSPL